MDDFGDHFEKTRKQIVIMQWVGGAVGLAIAATLIWAVYTLVTHFTG